MKNSLLLIAVLLGTGLASAQGYYDDDIYFDASKAKKAVKESQPAKNIYTGYTSYPAADTYTPEGGSTRSVDEYNRRGIFAVPHSTDTISVDSLVAMGDFSYTRRIERFYNPEVVIENPDKSITEIYYGNDVNPEIKIYLNAHGYWGDLYNYGYDPFWSPGWGWGWWGPYWNSNWGWGSPYYGMGLGPSWSWGFGPTWIWGWGWGPNWNWGWGPGWGWGGPTWGWAPSIPTPPANGRPINGVRPGGDTHYAGSYRRSSGNGNFHWNTGSMGGRPSAGSMSRPAQGSINNGIQYRPGANGTYRNGASSRNDSYNSNNSTGSYRREQNNSQMNSHHNTSNSNNNSSYRNNSSSGGSYRSSSSGMGGAMRSGAGSAGSMRGGAGGGGGASRGGRR